MRSRESLLFLGLATTICLLAGVIFGIATGAAVDGRSRSVTDMPPLPTTARAGAASPTPGAQRSLLIIVLDDAETVDPLLEGCWVISFRPGIPEYYAVGFAPGTQFEISSLPAPQTLAEIFAEDRRLQLGYRFVRDAVAGRFPGLAIRADVVLDRADITDLVTALDDAPLAGEALPASALLDRYLATETGSGQRLELQGQVLEAVFRGLQSQGWTPYDLADHLTKVPRIGADPSKVAALDRLAADAPALGEATLTWATYAATPEAAPGQ